MKHPLRQILQTADSTIFSVTFTKKDGSVREMNCRLGVSKGVKGTATSAQKNADFVHDTMTVYDVKNKGFRKINLNSVTSVKMRGVKFNVNNA